MGGWVLKLQVLTYKLMFLNECEHFMEAQRPILASVVIWAGFVCLWACLLYCRFEYAWKEMM
jgi:hypothetical protein